MTQIHQLRDAILASPLEISNFGESPEPGTLYLPPSHLKALRLDAHIVVGGRGVGKSFWTAALQSKPLRDQLGSVSSELQDIKVFAGFSGVEVIDSYPNADVFSTFFSRNGDPYDLWRAVILRWIARESGQNIPSQTWQSTVDWLKSDPEAAARMM